MPVSNRLLSLLDNSPAAASSEFNFASIAGLEAWLKPDATTMGTTNVTPMTNPGNGDFVGRWEDQTGNGNHFTQSSIGNKRPTLATAVQNSLPMVLFDGSDDYLISNPVYDYFDGEDTPSTCVVVIKKTSSVGNDCIFGAGRSSTNTPFINYQTTSAGKWNFQKRDDAVSLADILPASPTLSTDTEYVIVRLNGTTIDAWMNGTQVVTGTAFDKGVTTLDSAGIGALIRTTPANFFNGYIGEFLLYNGAVSNGDVATIITEIEAKWGL